MFFKAVSCKTALFIFSIEFGYAKILGKNENFDQKNGIFTNFPGFLAIFSEFCQNFTFLVEIFVYPNSYSNPITTTVGFEIINPNFAFFLGDFTQNNPKIWIYIYEFGYTRVWVLL